MNPMHLSKSDNWYTPKRFAVAAEEVMGTIDLDPASCAEANKNICASQYYTKEMDGLARDWFGNVWCNPPYGRRDGKKGPSNQMLWSQKLIKEYECRNILRACLLVNACTGDDWFNPLWNYPICFVERRIKFLTPSGESGHQPTHSNVIVYFGYGRKKFEEVFSQFGKVVDHQKLKKAA